MDPWLERYNNFPKGLAQPKEGYRFSIDSLLLICFIKPKKYQNILDLGTGCGVIGIGLALLYKELKLKIYGIELNKELIECAKVNIKKFNLNNFFLIQEDIRDFRPKKEFFDLVVFNPPYRRIGEGRLSVFETKRTACFNLTASLEDFVETAFFSLKNRGDMYLIFLAEKLSYLFGILRKYRFEPKKIRFVYPRIDKPASLVLIKAKKNVQTGMIIDPPLILYRDKHNRFTDEFLNFCPFLQPKDVKDVFV